MQMYCVVCAAAIDLASILVWSSQFVRYSSHITLELVATAAAVVLERGRTGHCHVFSCAGHPVKRLHGTQRVKHAAVFTQFKHTSFSGEYHIMPEGLPGNDSKEPCSSPLVTVDANC